MEVTVLLHELIDGTPRDRVVEGVLRQVTQCMETDLCRPQRRQPLPPATL